MKWLFLVHQVRTPDSRERVRVWRLTRKVGTILYRNSVYVLPYSKERLEDFHWLSQQIRDSKGEASVFVSEARDADEDRTLARLFTEAREKEYRSLEKSIEQFESRCAQMREVPGFSPAQRKSLDKGLRQLEDAFAELRRIDFFRHPSGPLLERRLKDLRLLVADALPGKESAQKIGPRTRSEFRGKTWTTRAHIHIDRLCSAWLIRRFIDRRARFIFAPADRLPKNAIPFDVLGAEFTHKGDYCTFETLLEAFRIKDRALWSMAELVHEIDLKDQKFHRPESAGIDLIIRAIADFHNNDEKTLELGSQILDGLYRRMSTPERKQNT